jgi:hypothetical protein
VSTAFFLFCVFFAASHFIHTRAAGALTPEQRKEVTLAWSRQGVWPLLTMLCLIAIGALLSWLLGHNEIFMPAFAVAAMGVAIGYAITYLRELDSMDLPESYLRAARITVALTYGGAMLLITTLLVDALSSPWR